MRAVGRGALSATTGVVVPDVCDTIDEIARPKMLKLGSLLKSLAPTVAESCRRPISWHGGKDGRIQNGKS